MRAKRLWIVCDFSCCKYSALTVIRWANLGSKLHVWILAPYWIPLWLPKNAAYKVMGDVRMNDRTRCALLLTMQAHFLHELLAQQQAQLSVQSGRSLWHGECRSSSSSLELLGQSMEPWSTAQASWSVSWQRTSTTSSAVIVQRHVSAGGATSRRRWNSSWSDAKRPSPVYSLSKKIWNRRAGSGSHVHRCAAASETLNPAECVDVARHMLLYVCSQCQRCLLPMC